MEKKYEGRKIKLKFETKEFIKNNEKEIYLKEKEKEKNQEKPKKTQVLKETELWVDKYSPKSFTDLITNDVKKKK
jgi:hypothetical protein